MHNIEAMIGPGGIFTFGLIKYKASEGAGQLCGKDQGRGYCLVAGRDRKAVFVKNIRPRHDLNNPHRRYVLENRLSYLNFCRLSNQSGFAKLSDSLSSIMQLVSNGAGRCIGTVPRRILQFMAL